MPLSKLEICRLGSLGHTIYTAEQATKRTTRAIWKNGNPSKAQESDHKYGGLPERVVVTMTSKHLPNAPKKTTYAREGMRPTGMAHVPSLAKPHTYATAQQDIRDGAIGFIPPSSIDVVQTV